MSKQSVFLIYNDTPVLEAQNAHGDSMYAGTKGDHIVVQVDGHIVKLTPESTTAQAFFKTSQYTPKGGSAAGYNT